MYKETFEKIKISKKKYEISNLLRGLSSLEPDYDFLNDIITLSTHKTPEIRKSALSLLSNFNNPQLENIFISSIESAKKDDLVLAVQGLALNGTDKSIDLVLQLFSKTRDGQVRGEIVKTLRSIFLRNQLSETKLSKIQKFIGNSYPFFHGKWYDLKSSVKTEKEQWKELAKNQLSDNYLNLLFTENEKLDILLHIEKMKKDFIRYINVIAIPKTGQTDYSKHYTPSEDFESISYLFDNIFEKTKEMRADSKVDEIISFIECNMLPKLFGNIKKMEDLGEMCFADYKNRESQILKYLFGTDMDFAIAHILTNKIYVFDYNPDKAKYIDLVKRKWTDLGQSNYSINEYLDMKKEGDIVYGK